jgi:hypothetical protein
MEKDAAGDKKIPLGHVQRGNDHESEGDRPGLNNEREVGVAGQGGAVGN